MQEKPNNNTNIIPFVLNTELVCVLLNCSALIYVVVRSSR